MTEKQKEAINRLNKRLDIEKFTKNIGTPVYIEDLKIVLDLIETQQKQIDFYKKGLEREIEDNRENILDIIQKDKLIEKLKENIKQYNYMRETVEAESYEDGYYKGHSSEAQDILYLIKGEN